ncbi:DUF7710 domain-containing protein [Filimonas effusa]
MSGVLTVCPLDQSLYDWAIKGGLFMPAREPEKEFYSEYKKSNAGNFFTDKQVAKYWINSRNKEKA